MGVIKELVRDARNTFVSTIKRVWKIYALVFVGFVVVIVMLIAADAIWRLL